ncbi:MAG: GyrI-like domain-containing protein [Candidatus Bipolaricaulota bacterium]
MALKDVRIVDLPPMRVASSLGFGKEPENQAWQQMQAFAVAASIRLGEEGSQTYGFNNPDPTPGSEDYGYEIWLPVEPNVKAKSPVEIKQMPAGKYAVAQCTGISNVGRLWEELDAWLADSPYSAPKGGQWLEAVQNPLKSDPNQWVFDLYLPITV